jgi:hypothetical protein
MTKQMCKTKHIIYTQCFQYIKQQNPMYLHIYKTNLNKKKYSVNHIREYNQFTREITLRESVHRYTQFTQQEIISVNHVREYN